MKKLSLYVFLLAIIFAGNVFVIAQDNEIPPLPALPKNEKGFGFKFKYNYLVYQYIKYYQGRGKPTMEKMIRNSNKFDKIIRQIFREEKVPENLAIMNQLESYGDKGWNVKFHLWQVNKTIIKKYDLRVNKYLDERASFEKATRATAQYLRYLYEKYNENWEIALGAYYTDERNVDKAIKKTKVIDFWTIYPYLPRETRNFVASFLATVLITNNKEFYGFEKVTLAQPIEYDLVRVTKLTKLDLIANACDTTLESLKELNPELRTDVSPDEPYVIRVPVGKAKNVVEFLKKESSFVEMKSLENK